MTERNDPFAVTAGAYVLGALDPAEAGAFDEHLAGCPGCRAAVADVADLPALLDTVPPGGLADPPPSVLTGLLATIRDDDADRRDMRRRRVRLGAGLVGAAAAGLAVGALALPRAEPTDDPTGQAGSTVAGTPGAGTSAARSVTLAATEPGPVSASVDLEPTDWGTRLVVTCTYDGVADPYAADSPVEYALVVRDGTGHGEQVATWYAGPGAHVTVPAATALRLADITGLEMVAGDSVVLAAEL